MTDAFQELRKKHGDTTLIKYSRSQTYPPVPAVPTGSFLVDRAIGVGGIPEGRFTQIYGPHSGGKTTLTYSAMAKALQRHPDKKGLWVDSEFEFDPVRAFDVFKSDPERVILNQPMSGEEAWDVCEAALRSQEFCFIVVDSVAMLVPMAEAEADIDKQQVGALARLVTKGLRKLGPLVAQNPNTAFVLINQIRSNVSPYGPPENIPGGHALEHACSVILRVARTEWLKQGTDVIGISSKVQVKKNRVGPPMREAEFTILFDERGIDTQGELITLAVDMGIVRKAGAWFKYQDQNIGQGKDAAAQWLSQHPEVQKEIVDGLKSSR